MCWNKWLSERWKQIVYCSIVSGALVGTGTVIGWTAVVPQLLEDPQKKFNLPIGGREWLESSAGIAAIVASVFSGILIDFAGPCRTMSLLFIPMGILWVVMTASNSYRWLLIGRIVTGGASQILMTAAQPLIAEISQPDIRGMLSTMPDFWVSFGVLLMHVFSNYLTWQTSTFVAGIIVIASVISILFVPESPYWHIRKQNYKAAIRSLKLLKPPLHDVEVEFNSLREANSNLNDTGSFNDQLRHLKEPGNYRPIILLSILFILREFGGATVIFMYASFFFQNTGLFFDQFKSILLMGILRLVFTLMSSFIIDQVGRRALFIMSTLICSMVLYITGMTLQYSQPSVTWIPLIATFVFTAAFSLGAGPIPWILAGEMLPTPVRYIGSSICSLVFSAAFFLQISYIPYILTTYGFDTIVIVFATVQLTSGTLAYLFLPETKNRTLEDLQTSFVGSSMRPFKKQREGYIQAYGATFSKNAIN